MVHVKPLSKECRGDRGSGAAWRASSMPCIDGQGVLVGVVGVFALKAAAFHEADGGSVLQVNADDQRGMAEGPPHLRKGEVGEPPGCALAPGSGGDPAAALGRVPVLFSVGSEQNPECFRWLSPLREPVPLLDARRFHATA